MRRSILIVFCIGLLFPLITYAQDEQPRLTGQIAYIGIDSNVYLLDLAANELKQLTADAGDTRLYQWPTWSTDGRLAYFSTFIEEENLLMGAYIADRQNAGSQEVYRGPEGFNYAYWSPGNCEASERCRDLSILLSSQSRGMFVELVRDGLGEITNLTAGLGGPPFYYSWSPDGGRMLWQRNNQRLDIYDANQDRVIETLDEIPGRIFSPAWSPVDDRLLFGAVNDEQLTDLVIVGSDRTHLLAEGFNGFVSYNWSPDGNRVAYREATSTSFGPLIVVDAISGEVIARSSSTGVIAFFWAPDSQQIAYLTLAASPGSFSASGPQGHLLAQAEQQQPGIAWSILDTVTGDVRQYGSFFPTRESLYLMQFFDQFAQSHRIWSPDSQHLIYSEITESGPVISVQNISQVGSVPFSVAEGIIGIWSFE